MGGSAIGKSVELSQLVTLADPEPSPLAEASPPEATPLPDPDPDAVLSSRCRLKEGSWRK